LTKSDICDKLKKSRIRLLEGKKRRYCLFLPGRRFQRLPAFRIRQLMFFLCFVPIRTFCFGFFTRVKVSVENSET